MPLIKPQWRPGVNRENTQYYTGGGWYQSDKVRFRQNMPEKIGGWTQYSTSTFLGVCRLLWNWITLANQNFVAVGTNLKFYVTLGNQYYDITPVRVVSTLTNPFSATAGSAKITVTASLHGALTGDFVTFSGATGLGGTITAAVLNQQYQITVTSTSTYTFIATATANSSDTGNGGTVTATYQVNTGPAIQTPFNGWGASYWNAGVWGTGGTTKSSLQIWNAYNYGENLLYGPRGGGIYYWQPAVNTTANPGVLLNSLGGTVTVTSASPGVVTASGVSLPNNSSIQLNATGSMPSGLSANTTYYVTNSTGTSFSLASTPGGSAINTSSTGSGVYISDLGDVPIYQNVLTVSDASRFVIVFGTNAYQSSVLDPMLIRWSDQANLLVWYPDITNQAGSVRLSHGSQIVTTVQTRQEIVTITDQAVYSLQYVGPPFVWATQLMGENTSIIGPNAAVYASGVVYWMGVDKFYMYSGGAVNTLNCDLRRYVFQNINIQQNQQVYCSTVEGFNEVWWFYCAGTDTIPNNYVVYNYVDKIWYYGTMNRTAWLDTTLQSNPIGASYNATTQTGGLLNQESGVDDVSTGTPAPIDAYIQSSEFDIQQGDHFSFVWRMLPDLTFTGSNTTNTTPQVTMTLYPLNSSGSGTGTGNTDTVTYQGSSYTVTDKFTGIVYTRIRGRQLIFKMESNQIGTTWQLGAVRFDIREDGRR